MTNRVIDFHNHIFPKKVASKVVNHLSGYYHCDMQGTGQIDDLLKLSHEAGMTKLVVHSTATKVDQVDQINSYLGDLVEEQAGYFIGFGTMHPAFEQIEEELDRIESLGLRGIKFHPDFQGFEIDCEEMFRIYEMIGTRFPVLMHVGDEVSDLSNPKRLRNAIDNFPNITFIAAHFGGYSRWEEAYDYLAGQNLYFDTSSSLGKLSDQDAMKIIHKHGAEKVLYASDYPLMTHKNCLKRFLELPLSNEEQELILYQNAANLLQLKEE